MIAFAAGGALDVQVEGKSGILFRPQTTEALCEAIERAYAHDWDPELIRQNAMRFDMPSFRAKIQHVIATTSPGDRRDEAGDRRRNPTGPPREGDRRRAVVKAGRFAWFDRRRHILASDGKTVVGERPSSAPSDIVSVEAPTILITPDLPAISERPEEEQTVPPAPRADAQTQLHDAALATGEVAPLPALQLITRNGQYLNGGSMRDTEED